MRLHRMPAMWRNRHALWWGALARVGLPEARWQSLRRWQRRAIKTGIVGALAMAILAPLYGFKASAYIAFLVVAAIYIPEWDRPRVQMRGRAARPGRFVLPVAVLLIVCT